MKETVITIDSVIWEELYKTYYKRILKQCDIFTNNFADAEDIAQDVMITLGRKFNTFRGDSLFTSWLYRVTSRQISKAFRSKNRFPKLTDNGDIVAFSDAIQINDIKSYQKTEEVYFNRLAIDNVLKIIESLPDEGYRQILLLYVSGDTHREIAKKLEINEGTVKSQIDKIRKAIIKKINDNNKLLKASLN